MKVSKIVPVTLGLLSFSLTAFGEEKQRPNVAGAKAMFREVERIVRTDFVDADRSADDGRYSAAIHGLLRELGPNNQLLTPKELKWMKGSVKGSIAGIGVVFEKVEDLVVVKEVLPDAPASSTRMKSKDRILAVDGKFIAESSVGDIASMIRGAIGSSVELLMQRGAEEWTETITRGAVTVHSVQSHVRDDGVGYVRITSFTENVTKDLDAALAGFTKRRVQRAVLDLRGCPGGLFSVSTEVADRFIPVGAVIVTTRHRNGTERIERAKNAPRYDGKLVVLVDEESASSAEIVAASLAENDRATVIGEKTFGKGTVEKIFELSGGYGLKLTVARFYSPRGNNWQGTGIVPDFVIPSDFRPDPTYTKAPVADLEKDPQLKAALGVLNF